MQVPSGYSFSAHTDTIARAHVRTRISELSIIPYMPRWKPHVGIITNGRQKWCIFPSSRRLAGLCHRS